MIARLPGGRALLDESGTGSQPVRRFSPVAYCAPDEGRDLAAAGLLENKQLSAPTLDETNHALIFECYSALSLAADEAPIKYRICIAFDGVDSLCTCPDFQQRGGYCKHMRAAFGLIQYLQSTGTLGRLKFTLPTSPEEAYDARTKKLAESLPPSTATLFYPDPTNPEHAALNPINDAVRAVEEIARASGDSDAAATIVPDDEEDEEDRLSDAVSTSSWDIESEAAFTSDTETIPSRPASEMAPEDALDFPASNQQLRAVQGTSGSGIQEQALGAVLFDLEKAAPKLGRMALLLQSVHLSADAHSDLVRLEDAHGHLSALVGQLNRILTEALSCPPSTSTSDVFTSEAPGSRSTSPVTDVASNQVASTSSTPPRSMRVVKRPRTAVIPPSPEKRKQKRKQSYGYH